jgi:hypothetical protein
MRENSEIVEFAKDITSKRIRGILVAFIGGRRKGITPNHVIGQMKSAIKYRILTIEKCEEIISNVEAEIEENKLFPYGPLSKKDRIERVEEIKKRFVAEIKK